MMYLAFAASAFQTWLAYRGQVWAFVIGEFVEISAKVAIWAAVYAGVASVDGISLQQMTTYGIIGASVQATWRWDRFIRRIGEEIKTGDIAVFLLKPVRYPAMLFSSECGSLGFALLSVMLPVTVLAGLLYGLVPPASAAHGALFVAFWLLGFVILFLLATIAALLSFWMMTAFSLEWALGTLLVILSGRIVPLWFFPATVAAVLNGLPFAWIAYHPMAVYLGEASVPEALWLLGGGLAWATVLAGGVALLWNLASRRLVVQGG